MGHSLDAPRTTPGTICASQAEASDRHEIFVNVRSYETCRELRVPGRRCSRKRKTVFLFIAYYL
jgi:hypothetical protein